MCLVLNMFFIRLRLYSLIESVVKIVFSVIIYLYFVLSLLSGRLTLLNKFFTFSGLFSKYHAFLDIIYLAMLSRQYYYGAICSLELVQNEQQNKGGLVIFLYTFLLVGNIDILRF